MSDPQAFVAPGLVLGSPNYPGAVAVDTPVVLAPMAGVTTVAFRQLCAEQGAGLYICEMITARAVLIGDYKTTEMLAFAENEKVRSVQLYGVDAEVIAKAVRVIIEQHGVNHVDLNFGCPVPKVTRKGGGGVLPWKLDRFEAIVKAAVAAGDEYGVPVSVKSRIGIDFDHITYLDAGKIAEACGAAAFCLHARTVEEAYSGVAHWEYIANLVDHLSIPVLGNGDIWEASDGVEMMRQTGCAGVEIGRGCLGRPWLFKDLAARFSGGLETKMPTLGEVCETIYRHAQLQAKYMGEQRGMRDLRKHIAWYLRGYPVGGEVRAELSLVSSLDQLSQLLNKLDKQAEFPPDLLGKPRGRQGSPRNKVIMPYGWLNDRCGLDLDLSAAEQDSSGG